MLPICSAAVQQRSARSCLAAGSDGLAQNTAAAPSLMMAPRRNRSSARLLRSLTGKHDQESLRLAPFLPMPHSRYKRLETPRSVRRRASAPARFHLNAGHALQHSRSRFRVSACLDASSVLESRSHSRWASALCVEPHAGSAPARVPAPTGRIVEILHAVERAEYSALKILAADRNPSRRQHWRPPSAAIEKLLGHFCTSSA